ncbi:MAG: cephalosporin-C deacetylase [Verrucomicrobiales bacterium]|jgi:cephalosporin-C deacetylase
MKLLFPLILLSLARLSFAAVTIDISTDRDDSIYDLGAEVTFTITAKENDQPIDPSKIQWTLSVDGFGKLQEGQGPLAKGSIDHPGFLLLTGTATGADGKKVTGYASAGSAPTKIPVSMKPPADFDEFWAAQRAKLAKSPMEFTQEPAKAEKGIEAVDIQIQAETDGPPVSGYFAKPTAAEPKSLPAVLWVHGAGVRSSSLGQALIGARGGFLSMDINAHGIPNGKQGDFYKELTAGKLNNYRFDGRESRDTIYFRGMILRLARAIDFLTSQPEWDGKVMAVIGHSQGGLQALAAGGLDDRVTFIGSGVPAGCDHTGMVADRISGWPKIVPNPSGEEPDPAIIKATRYIDAVNFASRCKADAIVSVGFIDRVCPPTSVYAAYNALSGKKQIINEPAMGHAAPEPIKKQFWEALEAHVASKSADTR